MPRNKTAKRIAKRTATKNTAATKQKMDKDFIGVPAKLTAQLNKEIASLQQKEEKLKKAQHKAKVQAKTWEIRIKAASKAKHTAAAKKQLSAAKKALASVSKTQAGLSKELSQTMQLLEVAINKQAKHNAITKLLNQFEKEWARNSKKAKAANKAKIKAKTKKSAVRRVKETTHSDLTAMDQPHFTSIETTHSDNEVRFDEATESTS